MAALTLAACGNNDAGAKPAGSSEPKTEQNSTNSKSSSLNEYSNENQNLKQFVNSVKNAGFEIVPNSVRDNDGDIGVNVKVEDYSGVIGKYGPDEYFVNFKDSLGSDASGVAHNNEELSKMFDQIKQMIANK